MNRNFITLFAFVAALAPVFASASCVPFNRSLHLGMRGEDVMRVQVILNTDSSTQISMSGAGSLGNETNYFGPAMQKAMKEFQSKHAVEIYGTMHAVPSGKAGLNTLGLLSKLNCSKIGSSASAAPSQGATATTSVVSEGGDANITEPLIRLSSPTDVHVGETMTVNGLNLSNVRTILLDSQGGTVSHHYSFPSSIITNNSGKVITLKMPEVAAGNYRLTLGLANPTYAYRYKYVASNVHVVGGAVSTTACKGASSAECIPEATAACAISVSPAVISWGDTFTLDTGNCPNIAKVSSIHFDAASGTPAFLYAYPDFLPSATAGSGMVLKIVGNTLTLRAPQVKPGVYQVSYKSEPNTLDGPGRIWFSSVKMTIVDKTTAAPVMNSEEDYALKCADHTYPAIYSICQPKDQRLAYLKAQFAKAAKPMTQEYVNSFGPGFENSSEAFADWTYIHKGPTVYSCDDAVSIFGLFGGNRQMLGNWKAGSNRDFYNDGKYIGSGGVAVSETQWVDKAGLPMVEKSSDYDAVGYCQHN